MLLTDLVVMHGAIILEVMSIKDLALLIKRDSFPLLLDQGLELANSSELIHSERISRQVSEKQFHTSPSTM
jgi:hypothetical protein